MTIGFSPNAIGALVGAAVAAAGAALAAAVLDTTALSAVEPIDRPGVSALSALSVAGGAVLGLVWLEAAGNRMSAGSALMSLALPVAACALATVRLPKAADEALDDQVAALALRAEQNPPPETADVPRWARSVDTSGLWRQDLPPALLPPAGYAAVGAAAYGRQAPLALPAPSPLDPEVPLESLLVGSVEPAADEADGQRGVELTARLVQDPDLGLVLGGAAAVGLADLNGSGHVPGQCPGTQPGTAPPATARCGPWSRPSTSCRMDRGAATT